MDVDPRDGPAAQYLDVGRIVFKDGSRIAEELSLGYKDGDTYCAAPIVANSSSKPLASYDFWAVGINCCSPVPPISFWCGQAEPGDTRARGGLRWMGGAAQRHNFGLAIEQAEAEYGYAAGKNPMLLTWT